MLELFRILETLEIDKMYFVLWDGNESLGKGKTYRLIMKYLSQAHVLKYGGVIFGRFYTLYGVKFRSKLEKVGQN